MKTIITFLSLFLSCNIAIAQDEWSLIHPDPTISDIIDAHFVSEQKGWVAGTQGLIMFTQDGGNTWEMQHSNPDEALWSIYFINDVEGWAVGWSRIYHTTNAGSTWELQTRPYVIGDLRDVYFINQDTGWIVGTYKIVLKTTNGGETWTKISNTLAGNKYFNSVCFMDELHGCGVGCLESSTGGYISVTNDGGLTWTETTPTDCAYLNKVVFLDSLTGWACGYDGALIKTIDGGYTWIDKSLLNQSFVGIHFFDKMNGISLESNRVWLTQDGGENWDSTYYIGATASQRCLTSCGNNQLITVGFSGSISKTADGGRTWENLNTTISSLMMNLGFFDDMEGLAITGNNGSHSLIRTTNGGYSWHYDTLIANSPFYRMKLSGSSCYLLNASFQLMKTNNAGEDWELLTVPSLGSSYTDLQFVTENTGYMCALQGKFLKTIDGSESWINKSFVALHDFRSLFFIDEDHGWLIDYSGKTILHTTTGGDDWVSISLGDSYIYQPESIFFRSDEEGYATTREGVLFKTTDGGNYWEAFYVFPGGINSMICFVSATEGWYKSSLEIYHTHDGGVTWVNNQSFPKPLRSMFFLNPYQGWLGGDDGLVAAYDPTVSLLEFDNNVTMISVFPNPATEVISVDLCDESDYILGLKIFNLQGRQVMQFSNLSVTSSFQIDISQLSCGAYILDISTTIKQNLVKFIKH